MKIFLLIYDWSSRRLVRKAEYDQTDREAALKARYEAELRASREGLDQEIVILEAPSLDTLKRTHGSYFFTIDELGERLLKAAS